MSEDGLNYKEFAEKQQAAYQSREAFRGSMHEAFQRVFKDPTQEPNLARFRFAYEYRRKHFPGSPEAENLPWQRPGEGDGLRAALERALTLALYDNLDQRDTPDLEGSLALDTPFRQELAQAAESVVTNQPRRFDMLRMGDYLDALHQLGVNTTNPREMSAYIVKGLTRYCDRALDSARRTS